MATSAAYDTYKLKKGETLEQLAKSHKVQVTDVWKFEPNAKLVAKRRTPDKCEPGDVVSMPLSKADKQAALAKVEGALDAFKQQSASISVKQKKLDGLLADLESTHKKWAAGLDKLAKGVKDDGMMADMANMLTGFAVSGVGFYKNAKNVEKLFASGLKDKATMEAVDKLTSAGGKSAMEALYGPASPIASGTSFALAEGKTSDNAFLSGLGTVADVFGRLTSPSGWAEFITGASEDLKETRRQVDDQYIKMKQLILRKNVVLDTELKSCEKNRDALSRAYQHMKKG